MPRGHGKKVATLESIVRPVCQRCRMNQQGKEKEAEQWREKRTLLFLHRALALRLTREKKGGFWAKLEEQSREILFFLSTDKGGGFFQKRVSFSVCIMWTRKKSERISNDHDFVCFECPASGEISGRLGSCGQDGRR